MFGRRVQLLAEDEASKFTQVAWGACRDGISLGLRASTPRARKIVAADGADRLRRNAGLDALRYLCAFAVVVIHALPWDKVPAPWWVTIVGALCSVAVPLFFLISGYLLRTGGSRLDLLVRPPWRLMPVFIFWMLLYCVALGLLPLRELSYPRSQWLWGGPAYHLWFLPALAFALVLVGLGVNLVGTRLTGLVCAALGVYALSRGTYHDVLHLSGIPAGRNQQYIGPLYVYLGFLMARIPVRAGLWLLGGLAIGGYVLVLGELAMISHLSHEPLVRGHDEVISLSFLSVTIFMLAKALPDSALLRASAGLGRISLGIYAVHLFILWFFQQYISNTDLVRVIILSLIVFVCSTVVSLLLQRVPGLRPMVS